MADRIRPRLRRRARRARLLVLAPTVLVLALGAGACGDDSEDTPGEGDEDVSSQTTPDDFPPSELDDLAAVYDPMFEDRDLVLTRAEVIDRSDGGYEESPTGTHLALYVEPTGDQSNQEYLDLLVEITAEVTPQVFSDWESIESYDICQEPLISEDDSAEPIPVTQVEITREAAADIDFEALDLPELLAIANLEADPPVRVYADPRLKALPAWTEAAEEAQAIRDERGIESPVPPGT
jgi:hypothetical protein